MLSHRGTIFPAALVCLFAIFAVSQSFAQSPPAKPQGVRDPRAVLLLETALSALGSRNAIDAVQDCVAKGTSSRPAGSGASSSDFTWKNRGDEFRNEQSGAGTWVSGRGNPALLKNGKRKKLFLHVSFSVFPPHLPALVLSRKLADKRFNFTILEDGESSGKPATRIKVQDETERDDLVRLLTSQVWFFDKTAGLPLRVEYRVADAHDAAKQAAMAVELADFRPVSGILVPFRIDTYLDGELEASITLKSVDFNQNINSLEFDGEAL